MQNVDFVETGFTSLKDYIAVWYWATSNDLQRKNQFSFQDNVVKVSHICECLWSVFAPFFYNYHKFKFGVFWQEIVSFYLLCKVY
jgi:hypothetical protein